MSWAELRGCGSFPLPKGRVRRSYLEFDSFQRDTHRYSFAKGFPIQKVSFDSVPVPSPILSKRIPADIPSQKVSNSKNFFSNQYRARSPFPKRYLQISLRKRVSNSKSFFSIQYRAHTLELGSFSRGMLTDIPSQKSFQFKGRGPFSTREECFVRTTFLL